MKIKDLFKYKPPENYDFNIQTTENAIVQDLNSEKIKERVFSSIKENLEFIQSKFNILINSDIIIREFKMICKS